MENNKKDLRGIILRALFIISVVIILIILAVAVIRILPKVFSSLTNVVSMVKSPFQSNDIEVSVNNFDLESGENFLMSWEYEPQVSGFYTVNYDCSVDAEVTVHGQNDQVLICNAPYPVGDTTSVDVSVVPGEGTGFVDVPFTVSYIAGADEATEASGSLEVNIKGDMTSVTSGGSYNEAYQNQTSDNNANIVSEPVSNTSGSGTTYAQYSTQPTSPADLAISNVLNYGNQVSFTVSNIGGRSSGVWLFTYQTSGGRLHASPLQLSLRPGEAIRYTLTFNTGSRENVTIVVDPYNTVIESSEYNNIGYGTVSGDYYGSYYGNYYYYNNYDDRYYYGSDDADLEIRNLEVGYLSGNRFREDSTIDENDEAAVRFEVRNNGDRPTGTWRYEITNLPYDNNRDDEYRSGRQPSLRPGEIIEIVVSFDNIDEGSYNIKVELDPDDDIDEERESNNDETARLRVTN